MSQRCVRVCAHFVNTKEEKGQEKPQKYSGPHLKFWGFYFDKPPNFTLKHFFSFFFFFKAN